jgi:flagellar biogenesis protein FliO
MRRWPALVALVLVPALAAAAPADTAEPSSLGPLLLRLVAATAASVGLCLAVVWLTRRGLFGSALPNGGNRLRLLASLPLATGSCLYLLQAGGKQYVAGVSRSGLQSLVPLPLSFDQSLARLERTLRREE